MDVQEFKLIVLLGTLLGFVWFGVSVLWDTDKWVFYVSLVIFGLVLLFGIVGTVLRFLGVW